MYLLKENAIRYKKLKTSDKKDERFKRKLELLGKSAKERRALKQYYRRSSLFQILAISLFVVMVLAIVFFIKNLPLPSEIVFVKMLIFLLKVLIVILSFIIYFILILNLYKMVPKAIKRVYQRDILNEERSRYCQRHRKYYQLTATYIITTCYKCFDDKFNNKVICLFKDADKLCFTADIVNGFINSRCDLGKYEIMQSQIESVGRIIYEGKIAYSVIVAGKEVIFAQRARKILFNNN